MNQETHNMARRTKNTVWSFIFKCISRINNFFLPKEEELPSKSGRLLLNTKTGKISLNLENEEVQKNLKKRFQEFDSLAKSYKVNNL